mgnify:CR=1 FL=1
MAEILHFPSQNVKVCLFTETSMYIGTTDEKEDFLGRPGIWLKDCVVSPISSQLDSEDIIRLNQVCVLWDKVVALSDAPSIDFLPDSEEYPE